MKNFFLVFLAVLGLLIPCSAQIETYDISNYRRPDLQRQQLDVFINMNLDNVNSKADSEPFIHNFSGFSSNEIIKNTFENSDSIQSTGSWSANAGGSIDKAISSTSFQLFGGYRKNKQTRHYKEDLKFIQIDYNLNVSPNRFHTKRENQESFIDNTLRAQVDFEITKGKGRFEFVTDVWHALTILEQLKEKGLLEKPDVDHNTITQFADKIAEVKNRRFTDPRFFFINEYEEVIEFLDAQNLIDTKNLKFFGQFYDLWRNERFISRRHGKTFRYGLGTSLLDSDIFSRKSTRGNLTGILAFEDFKAISKDWQLNKSFGVEASSIWNDLFDEFDVDFEQSYTLTPYFNMEFGYYPNLRTNYSLGLSARYFVTFDEDNEKTGFSNNDQTNFSVFGTYNFYVSPQLTWRLTGRISLLKRNLPENFVLSPNSSFSNSNRISFRTIYSFY